MEDKGPAIEFADKVRVVSTDSTRELGLAGLTGVVHGWTTPSITGVDVIGAAKGDYAIHVFFERRN